MSKLTLTLVAVTLVTGLLPQARASWEDEPAESQTAKLEPQPAFDTEIRLAHARDGIRFADSGDVLLPHATAPALLLLPDGNLLAVCDYAPDAARKDATVMLATGSKDQGRTWSATCVLKLHGEHLVPDTEGARGARTTAPPGAVESPTAKTVTLPGTRGDLVLLPDGSCRLYFAARLPADADDHKRAKHPTTTIFAATPNADLAFHLDRQTRLVLRGGADLHPVMLRQADGVHLYTGTLANLQGETKDKYLDLTQHLVAGSDTRFTRAATTRIPGVRFVGSVVTGKEQLRAYVSSEQGIRSLVSLDGQQWRLEPGVRMPGAWDPAVVRLEDGTSLMLYCTARKAEPDSAATASAPPLCTPPPEVRAALAQLDEAGTQLLAVANAGESPSDGAESNDLDTWADAADLQEDPRATDPDANPNANADVSMETAAPPLGDYGEATIAKWPSNGGVIPATEGDFPALPNFREKYDYVGWWFRNMVGPLHDNAFLVYDTFMPGLPGDDRERPPWPELNNMFTSGDYDGPPGPWDPAEHPAWAASCAEAQETLARFREASLHENYGYPGDDYHVGLLFGEGEEPNLLTLLLPPLSHHRALAKTTLADAWRLEDGEVSPERMLDAWETCFRSAGHLNQGATLIEELVSTAERALTNENARWALAHGVFTGDQLEEALDVLRTADPGNPDPMRTVRGEHAFSMDTAQWMFWPDEPGGEPHFRDDRVTDLLGLSEEDKQRLRQTTGQEVRDAVQTLDTYYRELEDAFSVGYPEVRAADIQELWERHGTSNAVTEFVLPSLSRVHSLRTRSETSRRATQLAYATHLYHERHGQWPASLDDLPAEYGYEMRTDPFTGRDFGYRVTEDGPTIYSLSENGIDDGGDHAARWEDSPTESGSDDHVFWPPHERP